MKYEKNIILKNGKPLILRSGTAADGDNLLSIFNQTHEETDYLLSYPEEHTFTIEQEADFLQKTNESNNEVELLAIVDGKVVGCAGVAAIGTKFKLKHRAEFGISIIKDFWGMGIGKALTDACIECAKIAGYEQLELQVVAENSRAIALYEKVGFVEFGRNPLGFCSKENGYQELVHMRLELL